MSQTKARIGRVRILGNLHTSGISARPPPDGRTHTGAVAVCAQRSDMLPAGMNLPLAAALVRLLAACAVITPACATETIDLSCTICHGTPGDTSRVPSLSGFSQQTLEQMLREFRAGTRAGTAMPRLMKPLTDAELRRLAQRFGNGTP